MGRSAAPRLPRLGAACLTLTLIGCTAAPPSPVTSALPATGQPATPTSLVPTQTPVPPSPTPSPRPTPTASPSPPPGSAPTSAVGFRFRKTVVPMGFPLSSRARYTYTNDFFVNRLGRVRWYNHANAVRPDGSLQRAHDGVDIHVAIGTPVLSPFTGRIVDPATLWRPWDPQRYGRTAVVISEEPTSRGYAALLVHLARLEVDVGDRVKRGQRIGTVGETGNAAGLPDHLHFEVRAPFPLTVDEAGRIRRLDAFDPYPSLVAADPHQD